MKTKISLLFWYFLFRNNFSAVVFSAYSKMKKRSLNQVFSDIFIEHEEVLNSFN